LRASLDHVVYTLVDGLTADPKVLRKIDFPIYASAELFERSRGIRHLERLLPAEQFAAILDAQPYKRTPAAPETDWLWVLSELDNIDKHRTILVVDPRLMTKFLNEDGTMRVVKEKFVRGAHGMPVPPPAPPAPSDTKVEERAIVVVLAETGLRCDNTTAIRVWRDMVAEVKAVIGRFEQLLP
jgi:hypothetical protein